MSAHVLLNLLKGFAGILLLFWNMFNKLNNTGAQMLDSIYHMPWKLLQITFSEWIRQDFVTFYAML